MTELKRKIRIMNLIYKCWKANPHLRFCQLIDNCFEDNNYYRTDIELEKALKRIYYNIN